jgi:hypothetical protein
VRRGLRASDAARPALNGLAARSSPAMHRKLCTRSNLNEASNFGETLAGLNSREDDGPANIELTYSTLDDINERRWRSQCPSCA